MKKILIEILCLVMLFGVSGCSSNTKNETKENTETANDTAKMPTTEKQKNIKDLKAAIPNPEDYLENDEHIRSEDYGEENDTHIYTYIIEKSPSRTDFFERYVIACKNAGFSLNYYESLKEENDEPLNVSSFSGFLMDDDNYEVMVSYYPNDDVVMIMIKYIAENI